MNTYAATFPHVQERAATGGRWFLDNIWRKCLYYVRCSNAWPHPIIEGTPWRQRPPVEKDS